MALYKIHVHISTYSAVLRGSLLAVLLSLSLRSVSDLINKYSSSSSSFSSSTKVIVNNYEGGA